MIRTTYRGRPIKVLAVRGNPHQRKLVINGRTIHHGWQGDDAQALDWFRQVIDSIEDNGGAGMVAMLVPGQYTEPHWYEPGTIDVNPNGHATRPGSICMCPLCTIDDPCGGKARFTPLDPQACRFCHQFAHDHRNNVHLDSHRYTEPTPEQRDARQAAIDDYHQPDDDPDEATCDAIYPQDVSGYLGRPRCLYFADHRDASDPDFHYDHRGFRWPHKKAVR
ncbi:hypothetical protein AB0M00_43540 [Streptomyces chartreusis]|uniref:hypothetical protein n=1 Tax=Streptomyces chartreusis TaxID=1969 RepID=UPI003414D9F3